ncbi:subunit length determinant protein [Marinobacter pelagius]|uniref:Subunit length determinant protein n=1 Tax=Marinobacter pelagius TaxID=379482 RepID=A0A366G045_9GAMM|nr:Wzz/FepE/Etk N-terminal domain-containing protein [Marinobacter pelagius]RBP20314.1 subunit length determinant protein [Marinobacter pelagius]
MNQENSRNQGEISLVDLATIFIRRIWLFVAVLVLFVVGGVVFALMQPERYEYVSLYQIAQKASDKPIESPEKSIAVLKSQKMPELEVGYLAQNGERLPFSVDLGNPENTTLVRISSEAVREKADAVRAFHTQLLQFLEKRHEMLIDQAKNNLQTRLDSVNRTLDSLKSAPEGGQAIAEVMQKQVELEGELSEISSGELLVVGRESIQRVAPNRKLIGLFAIVVGFIFAFLAVFLAEFASLVKKALREQSNT